MINVKRLLAGQYVRQSPKTNQAGKKEQKTGKKAKGRTHPTAV